MSLFFPLLLKMIGLYLCVGMGFYAARKLEVRGEGLSRLLFYLITPLMFLQGVSKAPISEATVFLPLILMAMACLLASGGYWVARRLYPQAGDRTANILGFTSGNGNMGYFGIPVALMIFDGPTVATYMLMIIGVMFYESTLGYVIATHGQFHPRELLGKVLRIPMLWGALGGLFLAWTHTLLPGFLDEFFTGIRGSYSILGMMMVGVALAGLKELALDWKFLGHTFAVKFAAWPLLAAGVIWLDASQFHFYSQSIHDALMLLTLTPLAVMSVIFATLHNAHPEKMATAVFLSTCFALIYVPLMVSLLGLGG